MRDILVNLKQIFCKHNYELVGRHKSTSQNLWSCRKCDMMYIQHWGMGIGYKCKTPNLGGWIACSNDEEELY